MFNKNPFNWDNTSETITSNVVDIVMDSNMNMSSSNFSNDASITVARDSSQFPEADPFYLKPGETNTNTKEYLKYHCFNRSSNYTSMNFEIHPEDIGIHLKVNYRLFVGRPLFSTQIKSPITFECFNQKVNQVSGLTNYSLISLLWPLDPPQTRVIFVDAYWLLIPFSCPFLISVCAR